MTDEEKKAQEKAAEDKKKASEAAAAAKKKQEDALATALKNIGDVVADVKGSKEAVEGLKTALEAQKEANEADLKVVKDEFQKQLDDMIADQDKKAVEAARKELFSDRLVKSLDEHKEQLSQLAKGDRRDYAFQMKDITTDSFALPTTAYNPSFPAQITGILTPPRQAHVRDFVPRGRVSGNGIYFIQEDEYTPNAGYQAGEGAAKPKVDVTFTTEFAPVVTIAAILKVSRQAFDDSPYIASYINANAPQKLLEFEDQELLYGDGNTNHLEGLFTAATAVTADAGDDNEWDRIITALAQLATKRVSADTILVNEADALNMLKLKASGSGNYLFDDYTRRGGPLYIAGKRVATLTAVEQNDFLAAQLSSACQLLFREDINIRIFEQNVDDVEKNMLTIRVEERVAFPIYRPYALVKGTLDGTAVS